MIRKIQWAATRPIVLANDACLNGARTGIGHYLSAVARHWPRDARLDLAGFHCRDLIAQERALQNGWPDLDRIPTICFAPLARIEPATRLRDRSRVLSAIKPLWQSFKAWRLERAFRRERCRGLFEPNCLTTCDAEPSITTMQDLSVLLMPETHPADRVDLWRRQFQTAVRRTRHWVTLSQATANNLIDYARVPADSITVIPAASRWPQLPESWSLDAVRHRLSLPQRYLLYLGTIEPRKNLSRVLDAYSELPTSWRRATPLILAGLPGWGSAEFWNSLRSHRVADEVQTTGYLTDSQAAALLAGATALAYPSLFEGFGLPVVEAMTFGVPVVASRIPSIVEVAGKAGLLVDPMDTDGWQAALQEICEPGPQRRTRVADGLRQSSRFSWSTAARQHHDLFCRLTLSDG